MELARREAAFLGVPLGKYSVQFAGAAKMFKADIWVGDSRNI